MIPYALPMRVPFRGITIREGMLIEGSSGWGDFCPFPEYDDTIAARWLAAAIEASTEGWPPPPIRQKVPVNCIIPAVDPARAYRRAADSGCTTAKVKVGGELRDDLARLEAVRDALGPSGAIRIDANAAWDVENAITRIRQYDKAAGGLEYVEQPCRTLEELGVLRRKVNVPIAADEAIRLALHPQELSLTEIVDVAVLKCTPLGGVRRSLEVAEAVGVPCVVSSALESSVGLAAELALAAALPDLPYACGLGTATLFERDVVPDEQALRPINGWLEVPSIPPKPTPASLEAVPISDAGRAAWWEARLQRCRDLVEMV